MNRDESGLIAEITEKIEGLGYDLVDFRNPVGGRRARLQVRIDKQDSAPGAGVTIDDCAAVSRALESWLDEEGIVGENYVLEVSSPGLERPVRWPRHWKRFVGETVNLRLPDRGRVRARIISADGERAVVRPEGKDEADVEVDISDKLRATLVVDWDRVGKT